MKQKIIDVMTIFQEGRELFPYWNESSLSDWEQACMGVIEVIDEEMTLEIFYRKLMCLTSQLDDGHTLIYLPESLKRRTQHAPVEFRWTGMELVIAHGTQEYHSYLHRPIKSVNRLIAADFVAEVCRHYWISNPSISLVYYGLMGVFIHDWSHYDIVFEDGEKIIIPFQEERLTPRRTKYRADKVLCEDDAISIYVIQKKVVVKLHHFMSEDVVTLFYSFLSEYLDCDELIFDVRGNLGGNSGYGDQLTQAFFEGPIETEKTWVQAKQGDVYASGTMMFYHDDALPSEATQDMKDAYNMLHGGYLVEAISVSESDRWQGVLKEMKVTILQDELSYSSAENFLINFDNTKRATLVGQPSAGSTGQPAWVRLRTGGMFMVTAKKVAYPNGKSHHNRGVIPDMILETDMDIKRDRWLGDVIGTDVFYHLDK